MHRVNGSRAMMSAETVFEVKTYSASMTTYTNGSRAVAPPDRNGMKIIKEYKTKLKSVDKNWHQKLLEIDLLMAQLDSLKFHLVGSAKGESFHQ